MAVGSHEAWDSILEPTGAIKTLCEYAVQHGKAYVMGLCQSGKSSLGRRDEFYANTGVEINSQGHTVKYCRCVEDIDFSTKQSTIFFVDEAHRAFAHGTFADELKMPLRTHLKYVLLTTQRPSSLEWGMSPESLDPHRFWFNGPVMDDTNVAAWVERAIAEVDVGDKSTFSKRVFDFCDRHVGLLVAYLCAVKQNNGVLPWLDIDASSNRVVYGNNGGWIEGSDRQQLAKTLLAQGEVLFDRASKSNEALSDAVRFGYLRTVLLPEESGESLVKLPNQDKRSGKGDLKFTFSTSWQAE